MLLTFIAMAAATPLQPVGKWIVEYNPNDCTLSRSFGDPTARTRFGIRPLPTAISGSLLLIVPGAGTSRFGKGTVILSPANRSFPANWVSGPVSDGRHGIVVDVEADFWEAVAAAQTVTVDAGEPQPVLLSLDATAAGLAALRKCNDDLLRQWGADPGAMVADQLSALQWFSPQDYPWEALRANEQGRVVTLTSFGRNGKPVECRVKISAGSPSLDKVTCATTMRRGRVPPVEPTAPERRFLVTAVRWSIPGP